MLVSVQRLPHGAMGGSAVCDCGISDGARTTRLLNPLLDLQLDFEIGLSPP